MPVAKVMPDDCGYDLLDARDNYLKLKGEGKDSTILNVSLCIAIWAVSTDYI